MKNFQQRIFLRQSKFINFGLSMLVLIPYFFCFILFLGLSVVKAEQQTEPYKSSHLLLPGDVLNITVYEHEELTLTIRIDPDGTIRFPLCGAVNARGETAGAIEKILSKRLRDAKIERAQVFVFVKEFTPRRVYITGEVQSTENKAQEIPPEGKLTVLQAISSAGGFTKNADPQQVFVLRLKQGGERETIAVDVPGILRQGSKKLDILLYPGDTIVVPSVKPVSVFGLVKKAGAFEIDPLNPSSVAEMISRAEGFAEGADRDKTLLLRKDKATNGLKAFNVKMGKIMRGLVKSDVLVQSGDMIIARPRDKLYVLGNVKQAGAFVLEPDFPITVTRAIAMAGGYDSMAAEDRILVIRNGNVRQVNLRKALRLKGDLSLDLTLQPGDTVFVPESRW